MSAKSGDRITSLLPLLHLGISHWDSFFHASEKAVVDLWMPLKRKEGFGPSYSHEGGFSFEID